VLRGFRQFDVAVSLVLTTIKILDPGAVWPLRSRRALLRFCAGAWDRGLGSVHQRQGNHRSDIVREVAGIPEEEVIMTASPWAIPTTVFPPIPSAPIAKRWRLRALMSASRLRGTS